MKESTRLSTWPVGRWFSHGNEYQYQKKRVLGPGSTIEGAEGKTLISISILQFPTARTTETNFKKWSNLT
jgi:hypothetical protein